MPLLTTGDRVSRALVVDRFLGEGAFAEVHRVCHEYLGWQAMKLFKQVASLAGTHRMLEEARLLSRLGHPNIVRLFDAGTVETVDGLRGWFTMEYVAGGSLQSWSVAHRGIVPVGLVVEVVEQVAAGLGVAHAQDPPILHRDLIPANILVGYDGAGMRVRIGDFGLAKRADPITQLASAQGTFAFMAPEVLRHEGFARASDVYSLGAIAYLLLTNHLPYDHAGPMPWFSLARFGRPPLPPSRYNDDVDPALDRIVLEMLKVDPARRTASANALTDALHERRAALAAATPAGARSAPTDPPTACAQRLVDEALALAREAGQLDRAADLMEEAVNLSPNLRDRYLPALTLWRRGVTM
jgi:serine/threonine-protein kinase